MLYLPLILEINNLNIVKWWVDASYAIHPDCKGHTEAMMSLGKGATSSILWKQRICTKSSTESELVGVDDVSVTIY